MSRIGKNPVEVPSGTEVTVTGQLVAAKGKLGELTFEAAPEVEVTKEDNLIWVKPRDESQRARMIWGTSRSRLQNLVTGVSQGYSKTLNIVGTGYRANVQGKALNLQLGFSHDVNFPIPDGIDIKCDDQTTVVVSGADKQQVGQVASEIRAFRKPEPYKGKGVKYSDEYILRKEGKKK